MVNIKVDYITLTSYFLRGGSNCLVFLVSSEFLWSILKIILYTHIAKIPPPKTDVYIYQRHHIVSVRPTFLIIRHMHTHTNTFVCLRFWVCLFRRLWCYGYRPRKWTQGPEFKSWTSLFAFSIALIPLGKAWIQLFSFDLWINCKADWTL